MTADPRRDLDDLCRDPDRLDQIAGGLRDLAADLYAGARPTGTDVLPAGPGVAGTPVEDHASAARRIADELDAVAEAAARAADSARAADADAAQALRAAGNAARSPSR